MKTSLAAGAWLSWKHIPAGEKGFFRAPVLITGDSESLLIDGGFTYPWPDKARIFSPIHGK
jgi:hypothetical protein